MCKGCNYKQSWSLITKRFRSHKKIQLGSVPFPHASLRNLNLSSGTVKKAGRDMQPAAISDSLYFCPASAHALCPHWSHFQSLLVTLSTLEFTFRCTSLTHLNMRSLGMPEREDLPYSDDNYSVGGLVLCPFVSYHVMSYCAVLCSTMPSRAVPCGAVPC